MNQRNINIFSSKIKLRRFITNETTPKRKKEKEKRKERGKKVP